MSTLRSRKQRRKGATAPLVAVLLIPMLAMVAFAVDMGYCVRVTSELQNAADAAALAGTAKLITPEIGVNVDERAAAAVTAARIEAKRFSQLNSAGNVNLALLDTDIVVGTKVQETVVPWSIGRPYPDSVQVLVRRDGSANGIVPLFFAKAINFAEWDGRMPATASFANDAYNVVGFQSYVGGPRSLLLPVAVNVDLWNAFIQTGKSPDGQIHDDYTYVPESSSLRQPDNVSRAADYIPEFCDVYPNRTTPGNFGLLNIGPPANDTPTFRVWIANGASSSDLAYFGPNGIVASTDAPLTMKGGPGLKSPLQVDFEDIIGQARVLPLYKTFTGQGDNTYYEIVAFAGVTFVKSTGRGAVNLELIVQPCAVIDATTKANPSVSTSTSGVYPTSCLRLTQ